MRIVGHCNQLIAISIATLSSCGAVLGEEATLQDLTGKTLHYVMRRTQVTQTEHDGVRHSNVYTEDMKTTFLADGRVALEQKSTVADNRGTEPGKGFKTVRPIGVPYPVPGRGGGMALLVFENSTLVYLRTFDQGGLKRIITFEKSPTGITCRADIALARENGVGLVRMRSVASDRWIRILGVNLNASKCTVE